MKRTIAFLPTLLLTAAFAAEVSFPLDSGDISLEENWGGCFPTAEDVVKLNDNGPYSILKNFSVFGLIAHSSSPSITVSDGVEISIMNGLGKDGLQFRANAISGANLTGGFFHMANGANCEMLFGRYDGNTTPGATASLSSVTISNVNYFTAVRRFSDAVLTVGDRSRIYSQYGKITHADTSQCRGNVMNLVSGSEWHVNSYLYFESEANPDEDGLGGGSTLRVAGRDTLMSVNGGMVLGHVGCSNKLQVADCARLESWKIEVGGMDTGSKGYDGSMVLFENSATGVVHNSIMIGMRSGGSNNTFTVASGAHVSCATNVIVGHQTAGNTLIIDNATLYVGSVMKIGSNSDVCGTDNTVILRGKTPLIYNRDGKNQNIYSYNRSKFRFEVPEDGYATIPIQGAHCKWSGDVIFEVDSREFRKAGGGDIVLVEAGASTWIDQEPSGNLAKCLAELNKSQPEGCSFEIKGKQVIYHASYLPPVGMRFIVR